MASKYDEHEFEAVLGTVPINSGCHYWEVTLDKFYERDSIILGVVEKGVDIKTTRLFDCGKFYGWMCASSKKIYPNVPGGSHITKEYAGESEYCNIGDTVGCIFEFKNNIGYMTFLRNGKSLGICFDNIPAGSYYPVAYLNYGEIIIRLDSKARIEDCEKPKERKVEEERPRDSRMEEEEE